MNPNIYNRPMFQNPQQRAGGGIMAGVAPINMSNGGDPNDTWAKAIPSFFGEYVDDAKFAYDEFPDMPTPSEAGRMYDEGINVDDLYGEGSFFDFSETPSGSMNPFAYVPTKTEAGSGMNLRDVTDFLVVDPEDPVDLAIAASAVGMLAFPPGLIGVGLAKLGYSGVKAARVLKRIVGLQKKLGDDDLKNIQGSGLSGKLEERARELGVNWKDNFKRDPDAAGFVQNRVAPTTLGQYETTRLLSVPVEGALDKINFISPAQASEAPYPEIPEYEGGPVKTAGIAAIDTQDPKIDTLVREAESDAEGGIAKVARSIAEARSDEFKSPTFRRGDKDLAAVTKEDLIDAGYEGPDALTNYLNDMKFDDELGEYIKDIEAKGKANGGIVSLRFGGLAKTRDALRAARKKAEKEQNARANPPYSEKDLDAQMNARREEPKVPNTRTKPNGSDDTPVLPDGGTATKGGGKIKKTLQGAAVLGLGTAAYKYFADSTEELSTAKASGASAAEIEALEAQLADANQQLAEALEDNTTGDKSSDEGNPLKQLFSKVRKGLSFDDPQKALYIAGQMMKPTEGFVPVNAFTAGTEAAIAYDKNKSEMARDQASVNSTMLDSEKEYELRLAKIEAATGEKLPDQQRLSLYEAVVADARGQEDILTLMKYQPDQLTDEILNRINRGNADIVTAQIMVPFQTSVPGST